MKTLATALRCRGSMALDRLIVTSGLYVIVTSGDDANGHWDGTAASAVECGETHGLCTANKAKALQMWLDYTANHVASQSNLYNAVPFDINSNVSKENT